MRKKIAFSQIQYVLINISRNLILVAAIILQAAAVDAARSAGSESRPDFEFLDKARSLQSEGKTDDAIKHLKEVLEQESSKAAAGSADQDKRALARLALALIFFQTAKDTEAEKQFTQAIAEGSRVPEYAYYYRGLLHQRSSKWQEAKADLLKVMELSPSRHLLNESRFALGETYFRQESWKSAIDQFEKLRKSMRTSEKFPDILFYLMKAEMKRGRRGVACRWAKELYAKYPTHAAIRDWGLILSSNRVDGEKLGCEASQKDLQTRVRRLQLGGEAERATAELKEYKAKVGGEKNYSIDSILANHLANEGQVQEALKLLLQHYESQRKRPPFLNLFAKVASRAGDFQAAIGAYERAYELAPRSGKSIHALFQAAFTSYQIQDYDGATRRFEKLVKIAPGSKLGRDAKWHLAWIRYLRNDYPAAYEQFKKLAKSPKVSYRRGRRRSVRSDALALDRIKYWTAMSLVKMNKAQEALPLFNALVRDPAIGYYAVLAYYRIRSIPGAKLPAGIESRLGLKKSDNGHAVTLTEEELNAAKEEVAAAQEEFESQDKEGVASNEEADAADETHENAEASEGAEAATEVAVGEGGAPAAANELHESAVKDVKNKEFRDRNLTARLERARDLARIGLQQAAQKELLELEARARKAEDRRLLISEFSAVRNYYRSSYMGEVAFGANRLQGGLKGESRQYWEYAYPRAWEPTVVQMAKATAVPEELIWGIMRAESHFRYDAQSAVGALGLMQLMPFTARQVASLMSLQQFQTNSLLDPETNIRLGSRYLQRLLEKFSGSIPLVAASYNAGPHRVHSWVRNFGTLDMDEFIEHIPYIETRNYVKKVVRFFQIYSLLYSGGEHSLRWLVQPVGVEVSETVPTKEIW